MDSPPTTQELDHPIETTSPMKHHRLYKLSLAKRVELNRKVNDAVKASLIRPSHSEFGSPFPFVRKANGSLRMCIDYRGLN
jgi:hypothetical protein